MVESSGLLNRRSALKRYRGFESPPLRQSPYAHYLKFSICQFWHVLKQSARALRDSECATYAPAQAEANSSDNSCQSQNGGAGPRLGELNELNWAIKSASRPLMSCRSPTGGSGTIRGNPPSPQGSPT